jgi:hypothetical protein
MLTLAGPTAFHVPRMHTTRSTLGTTTWRHPAGRRDPGARAGEGRELLTGTGGGQEVVHNTSVGWFAQV